MVEPFESGKVTFLPMSPLNINAKANGRIILRMDITNNETQTITISKVVISFPGSSVPSETKNIYFKTGAGNEPMYIDKGKTARWWFQTPTDDIIFDLPGPKNIRLSFHSYGYNPYEITFPLTPHVSPVIGGSYIFPASHKDLNIGEFWTMNGCIHGPGSEGSQWFGYDMGVWGINAEGNYENKPWLKPDKDGTENSHFRIWGKSIHAMADGHVLELVNNCPGNPTPLQWSSDEDLRTKMENQKNSYWGSFTNGGSGNHFYIQHGDEIVLYAHMQEGSLNTKFLITPWNPKPAVKAGEFLGRAGNSGNSSGPHLHIHAVQGSKPEVGPLRPIILKNCWAIDNDLIINNPVQGLWSRIVNQGIPEGNPIDWYKQDCFLWPGSTIPEWPELVMLEIPEDQFQSVFDNMKTRGFRPVWIDAYTMSTFPLKKTFFNLIFRPSSGVTHQVRFGLSKDEYQEAYNKWVKEEKYRLVHVEGYYSHKSDQISYSSIFVKSSGPSFTAYHAKSKEEHQSLYNDLTKNQGYVPVNISVVSSNGQRYYSALYDKRNVGKADARSTLSVADYQEKFNINANLGFYLAYLNSYRHEGEINIVAIWYQSQPEPFVRHHLNNEEFNSISKSQRSESRYLRAITGYQRGNIPNFAAIWNS